MANEGTFRIVAGALMLIGGMIGVRFRLRARRLGAKVSGAEEPVRIRITLKLCGLVAMLIIVAWFAWPNAIAWAMTPIATWVRWSGAAVALSAIPFLAWTFHTLGHNLTDTVATRANSYLVTTGPFRFVRHPFYITAAIFAGGMSMLCALWPVWLLAILMFVLLAMRTPLEERKLIERFGDSYVEYAARTGRFLPRFRR